MKAATLFLLLAFTCSLSAQEVCNNGVDDDSDGLVDGDDILDCNCDLLGIGTIGLPDAVPNPSFEDHTICPNNYSGFGFVQNWWSANNTTADYLNTCNYYPVAAPPPPPDGNGVAGIFFLTNWKEFFSTCLNTTLTAGTQYRLSFWVAGTGTNGLLNATCPFSVPVDITAYGMGPCYAGAMVAGSCPTSYFWTELGTVNHTPSGQWHHVSMDFTPTADIRTLMLGGPCTLPAGYPVNTGPCLPYFAFDGLSISEICPNTLPIELLEFDVKCVDGQTFAEWSTASESNNDNFTIWKSFNGTDWAELGTVPGAGNSNSPLNYSLPVGQADRPAYYRLSQSDHDGAQKFFEIEYFEGCGIIDDFIHVDLENTIHFTNSSPIKFTLYNTLGQIVINRLSIPEPCTKELNELNAGIYLGIAQIHRGKSRAFKLLIK